MQIELEGNGPIGPVDPSMGPLRGAALLAVALSSGGGRRTVLLSSGRFDLDDAATPNAAALEQLALLR